MSNQVIPISFALTTRMQSFLEVRDALRCMASSLDQQSPYTWLAATKDLHDLLTGEGNKKPATPNIVSLLGSIRKHFVDLAKKHPEYQDRLKQASHDVDRSAEKIREHIPAMMDFLTSDAWLSAYRETLRTQDILSHKLALPQLIYHLWHSECKHALNLQHMAQPVMDAIEQINQMLHAHVPWEQRTAKDGFDQITLHAQDDVGLIILGIPEASIAQGIIPSCSGFRSVVRIRFSQWKSGNISQDLTHDQNYKLMLVPFL